MKWWRREKEDKGPLQSVGVGLGLGLGRWSGGDALAIDRTTERTRNKSGKEGRKRKQSRLGGRGEAGEAGGGESSHRGRTHAHEHGRTAVRLWISERPTGEERGRVRKPDSAVGGEGRKEG